VSEAEIIKVILSYLPTIAIAIGVARIYVKISGFIDRIESRVNQNTEDIEKLISIHIDRHDEDAKKFLRRKVS
jgi:hypothetical protein